MNIKIMFYINIRDNYEGNETQFQDYVFSYPGKYKKVQQQKITGTTGIDNYKHCISFMLKGPKFYQFSTCQTRFIKISFYKVVTFQLRMFIKRLIVKVPIKNMNVKYSKLVNKEINIIIRDYIAAFLSSLLPGHRFYNKIFL